VMLAEARGERGRALVELVGGWDGD
jgi:hypothetical protein